MSSPFAIAGLTATLQHVISNGLVDHGIAAAVGGTVDVKAVAPDLVVTNGALTNPTLNIFVYQVTPNTGWRNVELASRNSSGDRLTNPPMALDIHYILSAYAEEDLHAEMLLGGAMHLLHEMPGLDRDRITAALAPLSVDLQGCGLADQVERIKITPEPLNSEEMSKLWSAIQSNYRPSVVYQATVVLIQEEKPKHSALPVLVRGVNDAGPSIQPHLIPPVPTILSIEYPGEQLSALLGSTITIHGHNLEGNNIEVVFSLGRLDEPPQTVAVAPADVSGTQLDLQIPNVPTDWAAGIYSMEVRLERPGESYTRASNQLPFLLAPTLTLPPTAPASIARAGSEVTVVVGCSPEIRPNQSASLILGAHEAFANTHPSQTDELTFVFDGIAAGTYPVRLRVDGTESWLLDKTVTPAIFDPTQTIDVPA
jgi:hypothetical protein